MARRQRQMCIRDRDKKYLKAEKILAKHDENYMPPEVKEAMQGN